MSGDVKQFCKGTKDGGMESMCDWLKEWIQPPGSSKGIKRLLLFNRKIGSMRSLVVYGANRKQDVLMNFCPFCGGQLAEHEGESTCRKPVTATEVQKARDRGYLSIHPEGIDE